MLKIKNILIPFDFSDCSFQALSHAIFLARRYKSKIHMLYAITQNHVINTFSGEVLALNHTSSLIKQAQVEMSTIINSYNADDIDIEKVPILAISPETMILEYASMFDIDLIVIGTHGRRGLGRLLLGSIAEDIVRLAICPVLTIRQNAEPMPAKILNDLLVPIDFSPESLLALSYAVNMAKMYGAKINMLHVIERPIYPLFPVNQKDIAGFPFDLFLSPKLKMEQWISYLTNIEMVSEIQVLEGKPSSVIVEVANKYNVDRIVMGTKGLTGIKHTLLGSVTEHVIRTATCPVFFVKHLAKQITTIIDKSSEHLHTQTNAEQAFLSNQAIYNLPLAS